MNLPTLKRRNLPPLRFRTQLAIIYFLFSNAVLTWLITTTPSISRLETMAIIIFFVSALGLVITFVHADINKHHTTKH